MNVKVQGDYRIVYPGENLGMLQVAEKLEKGLNTLKEQGYRKLCIDLKQAPVIDSSVIGLLVRFHEDFKRVNGQFVIICDRSPVIEAMIRMQLGRVIKIVESELDL